MYLYTHRTRHLLWILPIQKNMKHRNYLIISNNSHCIHGLCTTMRTNIILSCHCNYKYNLNNPIFRRSDYSMNLRRICSKWANTNPIFHISHNYPIHHFCIHCNSSNISPRHRIKQPHRTFIHHWHNSIPPILLFQRHPRDINNANIIYNRNPIST